jgi:sporulation protein YlmC with PRC-barrel domain
MLTKILKAGVAGSLLLASASAFAADDSMRSDKTAAPQTTAAATDVSYKGDWRASKVVGLSVYNDQNENVGSINDLLMDKSGNIKAAVLSVGGFLGMGARYVAVSFDKLKFSDEPVAYTSASSSTAPGGGGGNMAKPAGSPSTTTGSTAGTSPATSKSNPWYPDHAVFNATKDDLQKMPEFKYSTE